MAVGKVNVLGGGDYKRGQVLDGFTQVSGGFRKDKDVGLGSSAEYATFPSDINNNKLLVLPGNAQNMPARVFDTMADTYISSRHINQAGKGVMLHDGDFLITINGTHMLYRYDPTLTAANQVVWASNITDMGAGGGSRMFGSIKRQRSKCTYENYAYLQTVNNPGAFYKIDLTTGFATKLLSVFLDDYEVSEKHSCIYSLTNQNLSKRDLDGEIIWTTDIKDGSTVQINSGFSRVLVDDKTGDCYTFIGVENNRMFLTKTDKYGNIKYSTFPSIHISGRNLTVFECTQNTLLIGADDKLFTLFKDTGILAEDFLLINGDVAISKYVPDKHLLIARTGIYMKYSNKITLL